MIRTLFLIIKDKIHNKEILANIFVSLGLILITIHNPNLFGIKYGIFLPSIGYLMLFMVTAYMLDLKRIKELLGSKWIWIPMLLIVVSAFARIPFYFNIETIFGALFLLGMFGFYLLARQMRRQVFMMLMPALIFLCLTIIYQAISNPGQWAGGYITNTTVSKPYIFLSFGFASIGLFFTQGRWHWLLSSLVVVAMFFMGHPIVVVNGIMILAVILLRRDWSIKILAPILSLILVVSLWTVLGYTQTLYANLFYRLNLVSSAVNGQTTTATEGSGHSSIITNEADILVDSAFTNRFSAIWYRLQIIQPLGHGFQLAYAGDIEHPDVDEVGNAISLNNMPLVILDQLGIMACLGWIVATVYLAINTGWKYAWLVFIILGIFEFVTWISPLHAYWWALAGVSSSVSIKSDLIFKGTQKRNLLFSEKGYPFHTTS